MIILLAIVLNIDSIAISISYKARNISVPFSSKILICLLSFISTLFAVTFGSYLALIINISAANIIGAVLLMITGIYIIISSLTESPEKCDFDNSLTIEPLEAFYMGIILSFDSFCSGLGLGFINVNPLYFAVISTIFQTLFLVTGEKIAEHITSKYFFKEQFCKIISGLIIIVTALIKLL